MGGRGSSSGGGGGGSSNTSDIRSKFAGLIESQANSTGNDNIISMVKNELWKGSNEEVIAEAVEHMMSGNDIISISNNAASDFNFPTTSGPANLLGGTIIKTTDKAHLIEASPLGGKYLSYVSNNARISDYGERREVKKWIPKSQIKKIYSP